MPARTENALHHMPGLTFNTLNVGGSGIDHNSGEHVDCLNDMRQDPLHKGYVDPHEGYATPEDIFSANEGDGEEVQQNP